MPKEKNVNRELADGFRESIASVLGDSGSEAVMRLGQIPEDKLDPAGVDSSFKLVFGAAPDGLSALHRSVLDGMSSRLGVEIPKGRLNGNGNFASSLIYVAERYRLRELTGFGIAGVLAAMISSLCCLGPIAFALLGFASLSAMLSLAMTIMPTVKPLELATAMVFLGSVTYYQLRRRNECSLSGLRRNLAYLVIPAVALIVSYAIINYSIGVAFFGHPMIPFP